MLEQVLQALMMLFQPTHLLALLGGVLIGMMLGAIPGLGGLSGLALLLPFTFTMEPSVAIALMIGMLSVIHSTDAIPSILLGVPGTAGSQATILDGYPLAKKGEAQRALVATYVASILGGLIGTITLGLSIPILRPLVFSFGSPEFFMLGIMGITMVATLSSGSVVRGLLSGVLGLVFAMVGTAPQSAIPRWTFGSLYLLDGIPLIPMVLGLFAIPEMIELYAKGTSLSGKSATAPGRALAEIWRHTKEVFRHWFLVLRCGLIGTWIGFVPGLGSSVVDWFAYGHAASTEKGARETFGKGDIRGVIAPESANNGKVGGELIPTLAFGIPGSASMAIFLGALLFHDIRPGPTMLTTHMDLTLMIIWSIAIANIIGGSICIFLTRYIAQVASLPAHYLVAIVFAITTVAAFETTRSLGDLWVLGAFTVLGWWMKLAGWPRPPMVLGFVLGPILENYLFITMGRYGSEWITRPGVIVLALLILGTLYFSLRPNTKKATQPASDTKVAG